MKKRLMFLIVLTLLSLVTPANATKFIFAQDGFSGGGKVSGSFEGNDITLDGQISSFLSGEVKNYSMSFSGDSLVPSFSHSLTSIWLVVYDLGSGFIGDGAAGDVEGIMSFDDMFSYQSGLGPLGSFGGIVLDKTTRASSSTNNLISVKVVPIPPSAILLFTGLVGLLVPRGKE